MDEKKKEKKGILALIKIKARPRQQINAAAAAAAPTALETFSSWQLPWEKRVEREE